VPDNAALLTLSPQQQWGLVLGVLVFVVIFGGFIYLSKRLQGRAPFSGKRVKVIDRMMLTRDSAILLVQVGNRLLAVGVGKGAPSFLCELSSSDFPEYTGPATQTPAGFWSRFVRNIKTGITGGRPDQAQEDASFAEVLRQISEKDPVSGAENAGDAGYPHIIEEERRPVPNRFRRSYQSSIDNMTRLGEPDKLDRRSRFYDEGHNRPAASGMPRGYSELASVSEGGPASVRRARIMPDKPLVNEEERAERIGNVLNLIEQRQPMNDTGEER
jgi:flagellar biogenesis protein FliO